MDASTFQAFQRIAQERAGIQLRGGKDALVSARVSQRIQELGLRSEREYLQVLESDLSGRELVLFLDAISTNHTSFYRESDHFDTLLEHVSRALARGQVRFRFWCAASSTGEEPYSLAMCLDDMLEGTDWRILATDISTRVLAIASRGIYPESRLGPVPSVYRLRHFARLQGSQGEDLFQVRPELRARVVFRRLNLAGPPFPMQGPLDAVLCRNVMIYFDLPVRQEVVSEVERLLRPGAPFIIGHSETLNGLKTQMTSERPSVYRQPEVMVR